MARVHFGAELEEFAAGVIRIAQDEAYAAGKRDGKREAIEAAARLLEEEGSRVWVKANDEHPGIAAGVTLMRSSIHKAIRALLEAVEVK